MIDFYKLATRKEKEFESFSVPTGNNLVPEFSFNYYYERVIFSFLKLYWQVLKNDYSATICVCGRGRTGKTTLSFWLGKLFYICKEEFSEPEFLKMPRGLTLDILKEKIKKRVFEENLEIIKKLIENAKIIQLEDVTKITKYSRECFIISEAVRFYKRLAMFQDNITFIQILTALQRLNNLYILNVPRYSMLDKEIRNTFIDVIVDIEERGLASIYVKRYIPTKTLKKYYVWQFCGNLEFDNLKGNEELLFLQFDKELKSSMFIENYGKEEKE